MVRNIQMHSKLTEQMNALSHGIIQLSRKKIKIRKKVEGENEGLLNYLIFCHIEMKN